MTFSIRKIIRGFVAPEYTLSCSTRLWRAGLTELRRRTEGWHESGAFLLGHREKKHRSIIRFVYYDDLDPHSLDSGIVIFDGAGYSPLWKLCAETGLTVVADIHVHPGAAQQSNSDRQNPMIATTGHIALIVPDFAVRIFSPNELGIYEYEGEHCWRDRSGERADRFFYIGFWG
jgi:proteasome lid subunit RPN8/RPN11